MSVGVLNCETLIIEMDSMHTEGLKVFHDGKQLGRISSFKLEASKDGKAIHLDILQDSVVDGKVISNPVLVFFDKDLRNREPT